MNSIIRSFFFTFFMVLALNTFSQPNNGMSEINPDILKKHWKASWITCPGVPQKEYGVYHFRHQFNLDQQKDKFIVHVSADNRYKLYINGMFASEGPARGDLEHWNFETVDIAPLLKTGKNTVAAVLWNFGPHMPAAQISNQTAFILQGDTKNEAVANTGANWKVIMNEAYSPVVNDSKKLNTYIVVGPGDRVDGARYPWDWQTEDYEDTKWKRAKVLSHGTPRAVGTDFMWMLVPRTIPSMEFSEQRINKIVRSSGITVHSDWLQGKKDLIIPANTSATILLDQESLTNTYPEILVSRGKESSLKLTYAEALFDKSGEKGNRNEIQGKTIVGFEDEFLPDGGNKRLYSTLWFRTYRYLQLDVKTAQEPLVIHDFKGTFTGYPFKEEAVFKSNDVSVGKIWTVGWLTARLCAGETYFDCPYYEQLQYVGDTRIQALISLYVSGDDRLMRQAISAFDNSRISDGLTKSRYPGGAQVIPPYSLFWISMIHDYWMHRKDDAYVRDLLPGIQSVLQWYEERIDKKGMLGPMEWWNFVDWPQEWAWDNEKQLGGVPAGVDNGNSSIITLQLIYNLQYASELFKYFGRNYEADQYKKLAESLKEATLRLCWDETRKLVADTPEKKEFSQHANVMAVLTDLIPESQQNELMQRVLADKELIQCTLYYRFYLTEALNKAGMGNSYIQTLSAWQDMLQLGLTTFAERPEPSRSDCHAWSASPNYHLLSIVCGITPASPGFEKININPKPGNLHTIEGKIPHPNGYIVVKLQKGKKDWSGEFTLPENTTGNLIWKDQSIPLKGGMQKLTLKI